MTEMTIEEELSITCEQRDSLDIECARLEKEVKALRKDAERYRWLREKSNLVGGTGAYIGLACGVWTKDEKDKRELDRSIDEAMASIDRR